MNTLTAGSVAPDFSLHNQDDQAVTLAELKGKKGAALLLSESDDSRVYGPSTRPKRYKVTA